MENKKTILKLNPFYTAKKTFFTTKLPFILAANDKGQSVLVKLDPVGKTQSIISLEIVHN